MRTYIFNANLFVIRVLRKLSGRLHTAWVIFGILLIFVGLCLTVFATTVQFGRFGFLAILVGTFACCWCPFPMPELEEEKRLKELEEALAEEENSPYPDQQKIKGLRKAVALYREHLGKNLHGLVTEWHGNGQKAEEATYEDGKLHGPAIAWHENGQKKAETTFKDDELDGLATKWHENGQKRSELMWKGDTLVAAKYWNSRGEAVETYEEAKR